jgi:hypothetical protein
MRVVDNLIALRIIYLLVTPFEQTDAYKLGLIDNKGKSLKKAETSKEKNATSMLHRLVWNLKKIINLAPGGSTRIGSLAAAYLLIKEGLEKGWTPNKLSEEFLLRQGSHQPGIFLEEEKLVEQCLDKIKELEEEGAPSNSTGDAVSTNVPTIYKKKRNRVPTGGRNLVGITS